MRGADRSQDAIRFGVFEVDAQAGEVRKAGLRVKLQEQPFQVLLILLEHPGEVVMREDLRQRLWPADTFVDFDTGLNSAVKKLRDALGDDADNPRFIETLPRRGYRFIAPVQVDGRGPMSELLPQAAGSALPATSSANRAASSRAKVWVASAALVGIVVTVIALNLGGWRARLLGGSTVPAIHSIAVLPLENLSGDPSQEYFTDGMTDALITDLAQIRALRVISRTSVMQYKKTAKLLPQIARELRVDAVVEGTVMRSGNRVRVDAQLIRADTDQHLWADSYEGDLGQILALQSQVAAAIAREVHANLTPEERNRVANQHPVNPEAYELYLRGNYFLETRTQEGLKKALQYYQEATEKDPSYAPAFAGLADAYGLLASFGFLPEKEAIPRARAAAEKAVSLDGSSAEALTALTGFADDSVKTERLFRRAIELNPGYALAHHWYGRFLSEHGRFDESLAEIRQARSLDPLSVRIVLNEGEILFLAGQRDQALQQLALALDMDPNFPMTHWVLGRSLFYARQYDSALLHLRKATELDPDNPASHRWLAIVYEFLKKYPEAISEFKKTDLLNGVIPAAASARAAALQKALSASGERGYWQEWIAIRMKDRKKNPQLYAYNIAYDFAHLKENAKAIAWLETCLQEKSCVPINVRTDPGLDDLRSDPRFQSLLDQTGPTR